FVGQNPLLYSDPHGLDDPDMINEFLGLPPLPSGWGIPKAGGARIGGAGGKSRLGPARTRPIEKPATATGGVIQSGGSCPLGNPFPAPDFVVTSSGRIIPIPRGSTGPYTTENPGFQFNRGSGGNGLSSNVTDVRIMEGT